MRVIYHNLGQCLGDRVVYIRSTDVEQQNWHRLLWSIPDEWFYLWSLGAHIEIRDLTSNSSGGKIQRVFVPVVEDLLNSLYSLKPLKHKKLMSHYRAALDAVLNDKSLRTRIVFWENKIRTIRLSASVKIVSREPNTIDLLIKTNR